MHTMKSIGKSLFFALIYTSEIDFFIVGKKGIICNVNNIEQAKWRAAISVFVYAFFHIALSIGVQRYRNS